MSYTGDWTRRAFAVVRVDLEEQVYEAVWKPRNLAWRHGSRAGHFATESFAIRSMSWFHNPSLLRPALVGCGRVRRTIWCSTWPMAMPPLQTARLPCLARRWLGLATGWVMEPALIGISADERLGLYLIPNVFVNIHKFFVEYISGAFYLSVPWVAHDPQGCPSN